jgi:hypothetical protein
MVGPKREGHIVSPPPAPGWYPDPHDPAFLRFFDGASWTTGRARAFPDEIARATGEQPADEAAADDAAAATDPAGPDIGAGGPPDPTPADTDDRTPDDDPEPAVTATDDPTPDDAELAVTASQRATLTVPETAGGRASTPPPPPPPPGSGVPAAEPFTPHRVVHQPNATINTTTTRTPGRRRLLVGSGLVVAALLVAAVLVLPDDAPDLEWQGQDIDLPGETLEEADAIFDALVDERHGARHDDSRCYFGVPDGQPDQVDDRVRCGPVLFVDGDPAEPYLSFPLTESDAGTGVRLTVDDQPVEPDPAAVPADVDLIRHDGKRPPSGAGGLEPPEPPPAADDLVDAVELGTTSLGSPPEGAAIGSLNASYELTGLATVDRFGTGDEARRAPEGHQLIAFELAAGPGETPLATGTPALSVQIDGGTPRDITAIAGSGGTIVVAAPDDAEQVDLIVTDAEVEQRLSLLDGTPAPGNLRVLTRANRGQQVGAAHQVTATGTDPAGSVPISGTINVESVHLDWFLREDPTRRAANGDVALLVVALSYNWVEITPPDAGLAEQAFTLAMPDGSTLPAVNLAADPASSVIIAFEVPADFTTGTLNVGGVATQPGGVSIDFGASVYPTAISIPAG